MKISKAYITLLSVLISGAVATAIAISLILLGMGSSRMSFAIEQSGEAKSITTACTEEALQQIRSSELFQGNGNLTLGNGTCTYTVTNLGGQNREIQATGTVGSIVRKIKVTINIINPKIHVTSWQEVDDF